MADFRPDNLDLRIVDQLRADGRKPAKYIAAELGVVEATVTARIRALGEGRVMRVLAQRNRDRAAVAELGPLKEVYRDHAVYAGAFLKTLVESAFTEDRFDVEAVLDGSPVRLTGLTDLVVKNTRIAVHGERPPGE